MKLSRIDRSNSRRSKAPAVIYDNLKYFLTILGYRLLGYRLDFMKESQFECLLSDIKIFALRSMLIFFLDVSQNFIYIGKSELISK